MKTGPKIMIAGGAMLIMLWAGVHWLPTAKVEKQSDSEYSVKFTGTPLPTTVEGSSAAALAIASPTPTPPQISMTQEVLDKMIAEAIAKAQPRPSPRPVFTPDPTIMANVSEDSRMREGFVMADPDGKKFLRIYRKDGHPVTEGLTSDTIAIEAWKQPIYTNMGDGTWDIVFKERTREETITAPSPSVTP